VTTTSRPSPSVAEKAHRLLEQRRVLVGSKRPGHAIVIGDSAVYTVTAHPEGVCCQCLAGANTLPASCAHKIAASVAWFERLTVTRDAGPNGGAA
jgi:hypothetical protein